MKTNSLVFMILVCFFCQSANSQTDEKLAKNLISLRGQVEDLQSELKILKAEHQNSMSYLNTRKTEISANIDRKELQIQQSEIEITNLQEKIKNLGTNSQELIPQVEEIIAGLEQSVETGIPFKQEERKSVLAEIRRNLNSSKMTSQNAINQIWAFVEDEIRLTKENAIYSQTIELDGENLLVDVAKLGTVLMYFKTRDDKYGSVKRENNNWKHYLLTDNAEIQQVSNLFESLKKQIRQGYFTLPLELTIQE